MPEAPKPPPVPRRRASASPSAGREGGAASARSAGPEGSRLADDEADQEVATPRATAASASHPVETATVKSDPHIGTTIDDRYVIERVLGEGGMGVVYAARHRVIGKRVAVKVLRGEMATDREANDRFLQEARAASAIGNPHIVDISDFGRLPDGSTYFVMEFLAGKSLSLVLSEAKGPLPVQRLCHIAKQIAQGLAAAHAAHIIHRDLKPDNVMLVQHGIEKDFVKILDFGIAKVGGGTKKMTRAGSVFGTPHYMSPEQAAGTVVDHRTDVYALGVMLYEMASGKVPFDADNFMGILTQHMYKAPVPIRALVPEIAVPPGLEAIVLKILTKKPEGRYGSMDELVLDLEKLEKGLVPDAVQEMMARSGAFHLPADYFHSGLMPALVPARPARKRTRWPLYAVVAATATVVGVFGVIVAKSTPGTAQALPSATAPGAPAQALAPAAPVAPVAPVALAPVPPSSATDRAVAPAATLSPALAPEQREVIVSVVPADATLSRDGRELGGAPVALHLAEGEVATLVVTRKGYKTRTVAIGADEPKQTLVLEPVWSPAPRPAKAPVQAPASSPPSIDDVGDPFAKGR
jgi:eukaryotic-like serine/threonine-protein kinase